MTASDSDGPSGPVPTILEAIVRRRCIAVTYNRQHIILAPHILYTRHGELHVDAVAVERDGKSPRELKIGTYRLSGLGGISATDRDFFAVAEFDPGAERYQGETLLAVER